MTTGCLVVAQVIIRTCAQVTKTSTSRLRMAQVAERSKRKLLQPFSRNGTTCPHKKFGMLWVCSLSSWKVILVLNRSSRSIRSNAMPFGFRSAMWGLTAAPCLSKSLSPLTMAFRGWLIVAVDTLSSAWRRGSGCEILAVHQSCYRKTTTSHFKVHRVTTWATRMTPWSEPIFTVNGSQFCAK